jgi:hypothetical protein
LGVFEIKFMILLFLISSFYLIKHLSPIIVKIKKLLPAVLALASLYIISCQKETTPETPIDPPAVIADSNFVSRLYVVDSVGVMEDTFETMSFTYDNLKRMNTMSDSINVTHGPWIPFAKHTYFYNGADTLPYKFYKTVTEDDERDTITVFYYYNTSGQRIKDSSYRLTYHNIPGSTEHHQVWTTVETYDYQAGKIYGKSTENIKYYYTNGTTSSSMTNISDTATVTAGNITASVHNRGNEHTVMNITYDNRPSVYSPFNIRSNYLLLPDGYPQLFSLSKNNPLVMNNVTTGGLYYTRSWNYFYTFLPDGRTKSLSWGNSTDDYEKFIFTYTAL